MKRIMSGILILFLIFLIACTNKKNDVSPWVSPLILSVADWFEATGNASFTPRSTHTSVVYDNKMWVISGTTGYSTGSLVIFNDVWYSTNGADWTKTTGNAAFVPRYQHTSAVYDNKMWVIGGTSADTPPANYKNDVWYSTNGVDWTEATGNAAFKPRLGHTSVVYNNKMWVIGGQSNSGFVNDVWYSANGVDWAEATGNAAFGRRSDHTSIVYDNKMWVIGGWTASGTVMNDVWYSTNGADWTETVANAAFGRRYIHTSVIYDNKMWVIGGYLYTSAYNDVWYSTNGVDWTVVTTNAAFVARCEHTSVVYNNRLWIIGGNSTTGYMNDVWYTP